jgi:hypothetical protein
MKPTNFFNLGDRVKIKTGLFAGREGEVIESWAPGAPGLPWGHYWLTVQTAAFDGSKVIVHLDSEGVEITDAPGQRKALDPSYVRTDNAS